MPFSFNFTFTVPNPLSATTNSNQFQTPSCAGPTSSSLSASNCTTSFSRNPTRFQEPFPHDRQSLSRLPLGPTAKKRGWDPSSAERSYPSTVQSSNSGYLDTPAKYRDMAETQSFGKDDYNSQDQGDEMEAELPPPKQRRTLAGSIVSTALSAALIGTAVGFTVYRLWRDRGKHPDSIPPPPYQESEWPQQSSTQNLPSTSVTGLTPRPRRHRTTTGRRSGAVRHRMTHSRTTTHSPPQSPPTSQPHFDFKFGQSEENVDQQEPEDEMDWIGDKISKLVEEGKKALGTQIVVMSDAKEDEVDDGSGAWEEEPDERVGRFSSHKRAKTPRRLGLPPSYSPQREMLSASLPARSTFDRASVLPGPSSPFRATCIDLESSSLSAPPSWRESAGDWQSSEMKASMERAREIYRNRTRG